MPPSPGLVHLIGAGPGDPGLITLAGDRALAAADVVVYDHLVHPRLLDRASPRARRVFAGKRPGHRVRPGGRHGMSQDAINRLMIREARRGRVVARLKGGDPFVFGRGGEEALALAAAGVRFEVIPGVTAAIAAPAYAGIPVTHRGTSSAFLLVTGHEEPGKRGGALDWPWLARFDGTLAIYMGVARLPAIAASLVAHGKNPRTPAAVIERGTWPRQRVVEGTLATIAGRARDARIASPAMIVLGATVPLRGAVAWFEKRPPAGRRIVVTRAETESKVQSPKSGVSSPSRDPLATGLEAAGAEVIRFPAIALAPPRSWRPVDKAIRTLAGGARVRPYAWVVFLSANGVERFHGRLRQRGRDLRALAGTRIAAIGGATAAALEARGLRADVIAAAATSEGLARAMRGRVRPGDRVLIPRTEIEVGGTSRLRPDTRRDFGEARHSAEGAEAAGPDSRLTAGRGSDALPRTLRRMGAAVDEVTVYRTIPVRGRDAAEMRRALARGGVDALTFASAQTARNFAAAVGRAAIRRLPPGVKVASIGPVTSAACRALGLRVHAEARTQTLEGLVEAVRGLFRRTGRRRTPGKTRLQPGRTMPPSHRVHRAQRKQPSL